MIVLSTAQLYMLKSLESVGWPSELIHYVPQRSGGTQEEFQLLKEHGLVEDGGGRHSLTPAGRRELRRQRGVRI